MNITGKIKRVEETQQVTDSFKKRDFVITTDGEYPQTILFQSSQDRCDMLDQFKVGDKVDVHFNLRGREWTNQDGVVKVFNTLDAWKVLMSDGNTQQHKVKQPEVKQQEVEDDLPF